LKEYITCQEFINDVNLCETLTARQSNFYCFPPAKQKHTYQLF